jgi:hypothetical protein
MQEKGPNAKIEFRVSDTNGNTNVETLWATKIKGNIYKLDNSPFYAYNVSWEDLIEAINENEDEFPVFQRVIEKSGNKTVRICFKEPVDENNFILNRLIEMGCSFEGSNSIYFSINIPREINLMDISQYLKSQEIEWENADPDFTSLFPEEK